MKKTYDIHIHNFHIENGTKPSQLFTINWPQPFLVHDERYIDDYNNKINEFSIDLMSLNITYLKRSIDQLKENIKNYQNDIKLNDLEKIIQSI